MESIEDFLERILGERKAYLEDIVEHGGDMKSLTLKGMRCKTMRPMCAPQKRS